MKPDELLKPRWKAVADSFYLISDFGVVRNEKTGRELKPYPNNKGYLYVELQIKGDQKRFYIHRLVAQYFVDGYKDGLVVNHKDCDKQNNYYQNLEWISVRDNCIHAHKNGMGKNGHNHYMAKLLANDVAQIQHLFKLGASKRQISYLYGVGEVLINNVLSGKRYKNTTPQITLLTKRFKLTTNYPNSGLSSGDIIYADEGTTLRQQIEKFPGIFKELEWWEERKPEDMPQYVKCGGNGKPRKIKEWNLFWGSVEFDGGRIRKLNPKWLPTTEQEYNDYINSKQKA
jgi:hypothetical protein